MLDFLTTPAVQVFANKYLGPIGSLTDLKINKDQRSIRFTVRLEGESSDISINATDYTVHADGISFGRAESNRPWVTTVINRFATGKKFPVPADMMGVVKALF